MTNVGSCVREMLGVAGLLVLPLAAGAQTATPTPAPMSTPVACTGASRLLLSWSSAPTPGVPKVSISATNCNAPARCGATAAGTTVTAPPIVVSVTDANGQKLETTITDTGTNAHGCPGGIDAYRGSFGRLRFIFGARTTVVGKVALPAGVPQPLVPPVAFSVQDASGYAVSGVMGTCSTVQFGSRTYVKCH